LIFCARKRWETTISSPPSATRLESFGRIASAAFHSLVQGQIRPIIFSRRL
jgi:hypothetical protein